MPAHPASGRSAPAPHDRAAATIAALVAAAAAAVAYRKVLHAYFWNDDFAWLFVLHERGLTEFLLTPLGGHTLVARNAAFALLDALAGLDPRPWFGSMLVTHAVNVALLARLIWLLTGDALLAGVGALAWGACPAAGETLAWYSVYGQVAATTCLLVALARVALRARAGAALSRSDLVFVASWLALSSLFFGTVLAVVCAWPLVATLLVPRSVADRYGIAGIVAVSASVIVLYAGLQLVARTAYGTPIFAPGALGWLLQRPWSTGAAFGQLLRVGATSLLLGAWWKAAPRSDVVSWLTLVAATTCVVLAALRAPPGRGAPVVAFGVLCVSAYGLVAVARAPLAGVLLGQTAGQLGTTMRYHYVPLAFLVVALVLALDVTLGWRHAATRALVSVAWAALLLAGWLVRSVPVDVHDASRAEMGRALQAIDAGVAAVPRGEVAYLANAPLAAFGWLPNTTESPPGLAALFVITSPIDTRDGRIVRFTEPDPVVREHAARRGGRTATLLVPR